MQKVFSKKLFLFLFFIFIDKEEFYNKREKVTSLRPNSQVEKIQSKCRLKQLYDL